MKLQCSIAVLAGAGKVLPVPDQRPKISPHPPKLATEARAVVHAQVLWHACAMLVVSRPVKDKSCLSKALNLEAHQPWQLQSAQTGSDL